MELITKINWVDVLVAILMLRISYVAFRDGLSHEIFPFIGRILIMIMENYQQKDGSIKVPKVLQKYCGFKVIK